MRMLARAQKLDFEADGVVVVAVAVVVGTDAVPVAGGLGAEGWPRASAPERPLRRQYGRCWMTWLTWHPGVVLSMNVAELKPGFQQRSIINCQ